MKLIRCPNLGRPQRAASPSKIASPKKSAAPTRTRRTRSTSVEPSIKNSSKNLQQALKTAAESEETSEGTPEETKLEEVKEEKEEKEEREEPVVRVNVDKEVIVNGEVETTHTHVEVELPAGFADMPLPEDTAAMIAKAKEMVEAAMNGQAEANVVTSQKAKRNIEEVEEEEKDESTLVVSKRPKVEVAQLKKERVKTRTLLGISATLVIG